MKNTMSCSARLFRASILILLAAGCAAPPATVRRPPHLDEWPVETAADRQQETESKTVETAWVTPEKPSDPVTVTVARKLPTEHIQDMDIPEKTDVVTVLRAMAKAADVNILVGPGVEGEVTFTFRDVPWDQAFQSVISSAGLTWDWEGDVLRVQSVEDVRRELEMKTVRRDREQVRAELRRIEPMQMQIVHIRYVRAKALGDTLRHSLTPSIDEPVDLLAPRSFVTVDEENNAIIIHAGRENLDKALAMIEELDKPRAQIHIEARIVEATRDTARQLGVQWGGHYQTVEGSRLTTVGGAGVTEQGFISDFPAQFAQELLPTAGFNLGFISEKFTSGELLHIQLTALQRAGQIKILSSPSITTLDHEPAIIESGEERAYRVTTGTGNILDVSLEWKKAVLQLEVTPHIVDREHLRVQISANKDSFDETKPQTNNEFPVNTKHARTTVMLRDGQTVVIGGLALETKSEAETGVPYLMNIPVLGHLFKNRNQTAKFDDTLIFITPRIIQQPAQMSHVGRQSM